jgi:hypothetical protein
MLSCGRKGKYLTKLAQFVILADSFALVLGAADNGDRFSSPTQFGKCPSLKAGQSDRGDAAMTARAGSAGVFKDRLGRLPPARDHGLSTGHPRCQCLVSSQLGESCRGVGLHHTCVRFREVVADRGKQGT